MERDVKPWEELSRNEKAWRYLSIQMSGMMLGFLCLLFFIMIPVAVDEALGLPVWLVLASLLIGMVLLLFSVFTAKRALAKRCLPREGVKLGEVSIPDPLGSPPNGIPWERYFDADTRNPFASPFIGFLTLLAPLSPMVAVLLIHATHSDYAVFLVLTSAGLAGAAIYQAIREYRSFARRMARAAPEGAN